MTMHVYFKDGQYDVWTNVQYTDYEYKGKIFVVLRDSQWVGIYNMDEIRSITVF